MRNFLTRVLYCLALVVSMGVAAPVYAGIAIIAHPSNPLAGITQEELERIYLGKTREFSNGKPVTAVDQREGNAIRTRFYKSITSKDEAALKAYWSKLLFTGKAQPPKDVGDDEAVKDWVSKNPEGLGYVDGKALDKSVKVLLILP
jgi:ABC-type phosphate transport system substrate-binding protein